MTEEDRVVHLLASPFYMLVTAESESVPKWELVLLHEDSEKRFLKALTASSQRNPKCHFCDKPPFKKLQEVSCDSESKETQSQKKQAANLAETNSDNAPLALNGKVLGLLIQEQQSRLRS